MLHGQDVIKRNNDLQKNLDAEIIKMRDLRRLVGVNKSEQPHLYEALTGRKLSSTSAPVKSDLTQRFDAIKKIHTALVNLPEMQKKVTELSAEIAREQALLSDYKRLGKLADAVQCFDNVFEPEIRRQAASGKPVQLAPFLKTEAVTATHRIVYQMLLNQSKTETTPEIKAECKKLANDAINTSLSDSVRRLALEKAATRINDAKAHLSNMIDERDKLEMMISNFRSTMESTNWDPAPNAEPPSPTDSPTHSASTSAPPSPPRGSTATTRTSSPVGSSGAASASASSAPSRDGSPNRSPAQTSTEAPRTPSPIEASAAASANSSSATSRDTSPKAAPVESAGVRISNSRYQFVSVGTAIAQQPVSAGSNPANGNAPNAGRRVRG